MQPGQDAQFVKNLFGSIAGSYDRANDAMTFGFAHRWRRALVRWSNVTRGSKILDCATGTGDLAFDFARVGGMVNGIDFTPEMIELAEKKNLARRAGIVFSVGDILNLNFASGHFDVCSIAYGLRNVANVERALREMVRVVRPGGSVMILETGEIENRLVRVGVGFYFRNVVPRVGGWVSGRRDAYEYLQRTSGEFLSGRRFCEYARSLRATAASANTGHTLFKTVEYRTVMGGASFIYKLTV